MRPNKQLQVLIMGEDEVEDGNDAEMKVVGDKQVVVLIDCGDSHNFISSVLVKVGHLTVEETPPYHVEVVDGRKIPCDRMCPKLKLTLQDLDTYGDFFVFELGAWI